MHPADFPTRTAGALRVRRKTTDAGVKFSGAAVGCKSRHSSQQLYVTDDSTLDPSKHTISTPTEGSKLVASHRPQGRHTRPDFEPKVSKAGEPTGTAIDGHERQWRGRCWS